MAYTFVVDLKDNVSAPATKAAKHLSEAQKAAKVLKSAMESLEGTMVKAKALGNVQEFWKARDEMGKYKAALDKLGPAAKESSQGHEHFAETMKKVYNSVVQAAAGFSNAFAAMAQGDAKGAIEGLTHALSGLAKMLDLVVPGLGEAASAIIETFGAIAGATVGLIQEGAKLALEQTEIRNQLTATFQALGGFPGAGKKTIDMLDNLSDSLGVTRDSLVGTTKAFQAMGITNLDDLKGQIQATAGITAALGETGAAAYEKIVAKTNEAIQTGGKFKVSDKQIAGFREMGVNIDEVAAAMGTTSKALRSGLTSGTQDAQKFQDALQKVATNKFGDALKDQALSWTNVLAKGKEYLAKLFDGIDVKPFTQALQQFFSIFGESKNSGKAMKAGITSGFNELFKILGKVIFKAEGFFLNMMIWGLKAYIAIKPFIKQWDALNKKFGIVSKLVTGLKWLAIVIGTILVAAFVTAMVPIGLLIAQIVGTVVAIGLLIGTIIDFVPKAGKALAKWAEDAYASATDFVDGLVKGITDGVGKVVTAAKNLGKSAVDGVKGFLGIHSPSKVMMELGVHTGRGFAGGMQASKGSVMTAGAGMGAGAAASVTGGAQTGVSAQSYGSSGSSSSSKSVVVHVGGIHIDGAGKSAEGITEEAVSLIFERVALQQGL